MSIKHLLDKFVRIYLILHHAKRVFQDSRYATVTDVGSLPVQ